MTTLPQAPGADLSRQERSDVTADLLARAHATDDAGERRTLLDRVVEVNLRVAHAVAARYRGRGVPLEDLQQAACEGLIKAVSRFDPELHHDLLSYAVPTMRGEVQRYFRDLSWSLRPPRRVQELQWRVNRTIDELYQEHGREPTHDEVCAVLDLSREEYDEAVLAFGCFQPPSLDQPVEGSDALTLGDALPSHRDDEEAAEARTMLAPVVRRLSERDRRILYLRFVEDQTQQQIGDELGVAQMQVSRWLSRIYRELREDLTGGDDAPAAADQGTAPQRDAVPARLERGTPPAPSGHGGELRKAG